MTKPKPRVSSVLDLLEFSSPGGNPESSVGPHYKGRPQWPGLLWRFDRSAPQHTPALRGCSRARLDHSQGATGHEQSSSSSSSSSKVETADKCKCNHWLMLGSMRSSDGQGMLIIDAPLACRKTRLWYLRGRSSAGNAYESSKGSSPKPSSCGVGR